MMNESAKILLDFVEGRIVPEAFKQILYNDSNLENYLKDEPRLPPNYYIKNDVYTFLIELNYRNAADVLDAFGAVVEFLDRKQIVFEPTSKYEDLHSIILSAQPEWLNADTSYVSKTLLPQSEGRSGEELQDWLKEQFLKKFKYVSEPPEWLQNPEWLFSSEGEPLIFFGQITVEHFFHDEAAVYVFYNPKTNNCETIIQVC